MNYSLHPKKRNPSFESGQAPCPGSKLGLRFIYGGSICHVIVRIKSRMILETWYKVYELSKFYRP